MLSAITGILQMLQGINDKHKAAIEDAGQSGFGAKNAGGWAGALDSVKENGAENGAKTTEESPQPSADSSPAQATESKGPATANSKEGAPNSSLVSTIANIGGMLASQNAANKAKIAPQAVELGKSSDGGWQKSLLNKRGR